MTNFFADFAQNPNALSKCAVLKNKNSLLVVFATLTEGTPTHTDKPRHKSRNHKKLIPHTERKDTEK